MAGKSGNGRILLVLGTLVVGGTESQVTLLAERLSRRGWVIEVFALEKAGPLVERLESAGIPVSDGGYRRQPKMSRLVSLIGCELRLLWRIARTRPDVVHAFLPLTNFMGAVTGRIALVPFVITSRRALGRHQERRPGARWLDRAANACSDVVTANSRAVANDTELRDGYDASRVVVIPNGLDFARLDDGQRHRDGMRKQLGLSSSDIAIVMVANLIQYKGHRELVEAFGRVAPGNSHLRLFLIGQDYGLAEGLISDARRLGVADRVDLLGQRNDVPMLLSAMDLGVMSSHEEGSSNALLEKLAVGLPVVATNVGGNPEALQDMPGCVLVRSEDAGDLARGLAEAIGRHGVDDQDRNIRRNLVRERYSVDAMVNAYERLYSGRG
jgi:glycosyltransferase involved in cell wall biosynthesis